MENPVSNEPTTAQSVSASDPTSVALSPEAPPAAIPMSTTVTFPGRTVDAQTYSSSLPSSFIDKRPKKKIAIVFGYIGEHFSGLQWNHRPENPTIEEVIMDALAVAGLISEENLADPKVQQKLNWERASRTDKGVHALKNIISVNLMLPPEITTKEEFASVFSTHIAPTEEGTVAGGATIHPSVPHPSIVANSATLSSLTSSQLSYPISREEGAKILLNQLLHPRFIHVYQLVPVTNSFNSYMMCTGRTYEYFLPSFALMSKTEFLSYFVPGGGKSLDDAGTEIAPLYPTREDADFHTRGHCKKSRPHQASETEGTDAQEELEPSAENKKRDRAEMEQDDSVGNAEAEPQATPSSEGSKPDSSVPNKFPDAELIFLFHHIPQDAMRRIAEYRISPSQLDRARSAFKMYCGTHNFHNFTPGGNAGKEASKRFIRNVSLDDPIVVYPGDSDVQAAFDAAEKTAKTEVASCREKQLYAEATYQNGVELIRVELDGQSFMLNQIRKMVAAVSCLMVSELPITYIQNDLLSKDKRIGVTVAPANGLFLSSLTFDLYNLKLGRMQAVGNGAGKTGLYVDDESLRSETVEWRRHIVGVIAKKEMSEDITGRWLRSMRQVLRALWKFNSWSDEHQAVDERSTDAESHNHPIE